MPGFTLVACSAPLGPEDDTLRPQVNDVISVRRAGIGLDQGLIGRGVLINISDATQSADEIRALERPWYCQLEYAQVVAVDDPADMVRLGVTSNNVDSSGRGEMTEAKLAPYLDKWGIVFSPLANQPGGGEIRIDAPIADVIQSWGFWRVEEEQLASVTFLYQYQGNKVHHLRVTGDGQINMANVKRRAEALGGNVFAVDQALDQIDVEFTRTNARAALEPGLNYDARWQERERAWSIDPALVAAAEASGGEATVADPAGLGLVDHRAL